MISILNIQNFVNFCSLLFLQIQLLLSYSLSWKCYWTVECISYSKVQKLKIKAVNNLKYINLQFYKDFEMQEISQKKKCLTKMLAQFHEKKYLFWEVQYISFLNSLIMIIWIIIINELRIFSVLYYNTFVKDLKKAFELFSYTTVFFSTI